MATKSILEIMLCLNYLLLLIVTETGAQYYEVTSLQKKSLHCIVYTQTSSSEVECILLCQRRNSTSILEAGQCKCIVDNQCHNPTSMDQEVTTFNIVNKKPAHRNIYDDLVFSLSCDGPAGTQDPPFNLTGMPTEVDDFRKTLVCSAPNAPPPSSGPKLLWDTGTKSCITNLNDSFTTKCPEGLTFSFWAKFNLDYSPSKVNLVTAHSNFNGFRIVVHQDQKIPLWSISFAATKLLLHLSMEGPDMTTWTHVGLALKWKPFEMSVYINGTFVKSQHEVDSRNVTDDQTRIFFGWRYTNEKNHGIKYDDILLFERYLDAEEILKIYEIQSYH